MRALIVDDSRFVRQWMRRAMEKLGWACEEVEHGAAAVELLHHDADFDLMLVDANMPVMDGLACLRSLNAMDARGQMKVMMVTTEAEMSFVEEALELGADEFLMKPVTEDVLSSKLLLLGL
jgi:two-component system chemotaxis response regulator CheY